MKNLTHVLMRRSCFLVLLLFAARAFSFELTPVAQWCGIDGATRIACDTTTGQLYVTSPLGHEIVILNSDGNEAGTISLDGPPGAIELTGDGNFLVSIGKSVRKIDPSGATLVTYGLVPNYFVDPHDVTMASDGRVFVSDDDDSVKVFDTAGAPLYSFGGYGYISSRLDEPVSLEYNPVSDEIVVVDENNYRVKAYNPNGSHLRQWGTEGNGLYTYGAFFRGFGLDLDASGHIWTLDVLSDLVQVFDPYGVFLYSMALNTPDIRAGLDIAVDGDMVYVTSPATSCVYVYRRTGAAPILSRPLNLTIKWTAAGAELRWNAQRGAVSYELQRSTDAEFAEDLTDRFALTTDTVFIDQWASNPNSLCFYRVTYSDGNELPALSEQFDPRVFEGGHDGSRDPLDTPHDPPHHVTDGVNCNSCHLRPFIYPNPMPDWWRSDHLCKSCHVETGFAKAVQTHLGGDTLSCTICHSPHYQQPQYPHFLIRNENPVGESNNMLFNHATDFIHGAPNYDGICEICHTQTSYYRNDGSDGGTHNAGSNCVSCHKHENGFVPTGGGGACNACHGAPPQTGAHLRHFGGTVEQAAYGTIQNLSTETDYIFSCGTCHPSSSSAFHQNGTVDIELYDAGAPTSSLKGKNPPSASYDPGSGTCSNVYCHSATTWSSGPVGAPLYQPDGRPILDANGNLTYDPYAVSTTRNYASVAWNGGPQDCNGCHRNGPQTTYPSVQAGVGNSHGWIDDWGYEDLHAYNMASDPLTCRSCHYGTVTAEQTWSRNPWDITTYDDVALANKSYHVNGNMDVVFDSVNTVVVQDEVFSLASTTYNSATRTCSSAPCHMAQTTPEWGKPYRWWDTAECDQCHNMTGWFGPTVVTEFNHEPVDGQPCTRCHDPHPHN